MHNYFLSAVILSVNMLSILFQSYANFHYADCKFIKSCAKYRNAVIKVFSVLLNVIMLNVDPPR